MTELEERWGPASVMYDPGLLAGFRARPDDVLLGCASKSGTTWMQQLLHQLRTGGDDMFRSIHEQVPWLELPDPDRESPEAQLAEREAMASPRIFKTHLPPERMPGLGTVRVVAVGRDPRACCVSHFHHLHGMSAAMREHLGGYTPPTDFDAFVDAWTERSDWFDVAPSWWDRREEPWVHWVAFAALRADPIGEARRLAAFVGFGEESVEAACERSSLEWMRAHEDRFRSLFRSRPPSFVEGSFVRKGQVGPPAELSEAQAEAIATKARSLLDPEGWDAFGLTARCRS